MTQPYPFAHTADTKHAKASAATRLRSSPSLGRNPTDSQQQTSQKPDFSGLSSTEGVKCVWSQSEEKTRG